MKLSVIIPVLNGGASFQKCLDAIDASTRRPDEVIVADDGSTDGSADLARSHGATVIQVPDGPQGPAVARNLATDQASGDAFVFIDADVAVHPDALERIEAYFTENPDLSALFGSYDDNPPEQSVASRYKNLLHHKVHQESRREATTFWAGCGAVRRNVFQAVGGYDDSYERPSIEDIELGVRLRNAGYQIWSCPDVLSTHLKRWSLIGMIRTDIFCRAIPWTSLIVKTGHLPNDLNTGFTSRICALMAWMLIPTALLGLLWSPAWLGTLAALLTLVACNLSLLRLFWRKGGIGFAIAAMGLHILYYIYSSVTFVLVAVLTRLSLLGKSESSNETAGDERGLAPQS